MFRLLIFPCLFLATFADSKSLPTPSDGKIVGGYDTDISQVPHQVSVQYAGKHECGGSIIGPKHILTAAHCVKTKVFLDLFSIRAGSSHHNESGQERDVAKVISHPNFDKNVGNYDAAILVLQKPLTDSAGVKIATLANTEPQERDMVLVSGWGFLNEKDKDWSPILQSVSVPVVSKKSCKERYKCQINVTDQMFCAGFIVGGKDSCYGDSGGPAMVDGKLAGIVSWGEGCGRENSPTIYTTVSSILTWIANNTKEWKVF